MADTGNLFGTRRTLDNVDGPRPLEPGILSKDGWTLVDDSSRPIFKSGVKSWVLPPSCRPADSADLYFFGYGRNYKQALKDFTAVSGKIPLPPKFVFGSWWSRYWAYSDHELQELVRQFRQFGVPLDVLVIDMDWHLDGWTGYTWNPDFFPEPEAFLKWARDQGLKVTLNLHPADGVGRHEENFDEMAKAMKLNPRKTRRIPFDCADPKFIRAYFKFLHHPLERQGVDFWWMDWQQGTKTDIENLDPLWWLNHLHWSDMEKNPERRPLVFSRWGGLGNHRYPIGFSGDTYSTWKSLAFQPHFTATAGNVGYAYWSHDIGGHLPGAVDPELYARWIQWGALSPILRTHTTKNPTAERRIWEFPKEVFESAKKSFQLRYELIPYIYSSARKTFDTGLPICRPLYYEWPDLDEAYRHPGEYMFGDQLLAAPVTSPGQIESGCAMARVWFPPGRWTNWFTGQTFEGPSPAMILVPLDEIPLFVREGGIVPAAPWALRTKKQSADVSVLHVFPGARGSTEIYEDDGASNGYGRGEFTRTRVVQKRVKNAVVIEIGPAVGRFGGMAVEKSYEIVIHKAGGQRQFLRLPKMSVFKKRRIRVECPIALGEPREKSQSPTRTLGLFSSVSVKRVMTAGSRRVLATVNVMRETMPQDRRNVRAAVRLEHSSGWRRIGRSRREFRRLRPGKTVSFAFALFPAAEAQTDILKTTTDFIAAGEKISLPGKIVLLPSINRWRVAGPFDDLDALSLKKKFPPEIGRFAKTIHWREVDRFENVNAELTGEFFVDFHKIFGSTHTHAVAYAQTYLHSPRAMSARLAIGSDDGIAVWLNGKEIHRNPAGRGYLPKQDIVPIALRRGSNALLLKISQDEGEWGFCAHLETPDAMPIPEVLVRLHS